MSTTTFETELEVLRTLNVPRLRQRYEEVFQEPCRSNNKDHLVKRIAWRLQANAEGGLSERARKRAMELARDADIRIQPPRALVKHAEATRVVVGELKAAAEAVPGTLLRRPYKGRMLVVKVLPRGFEYQGEVYRSLSAIAKTVTGSHCSGKAFFGLTGKGVGDDQ